MTQRSPVGEAGEAADQEAAAPATRAALTAELEGTLGYRVCSSDGRVLGRLAWLRHGFLDGQVEALMIRRPGVGGLFSSRENPIPSDRVETVSHRRRHVVVTAERF